MDGHDDGADEGRELQLRRWSWLPQAAQAWWMVTHRPQPTKTK
jgi:hypothetical protein